MGVVKVQKRDPFYHSEKQARSPKGRRIRERGGSRNWAQAGLPRMMPDCMQKMQGERGISITIQYIFPWHTQVANCNTHENKGDKKGKSWKRLRRSLAFAC